MVNRMVGVAKKGWDVMCPSRGVVGPLKGVRRPRERVVRHRWGLVWLRGSLGCPRRGVVGVVWPSCGVARRRFGLFDRGCGGARIRRVAA